MVTSGKALQHEAEQAGFLVAMWQVAEAGENPGDDPAYSKDRYRYRIVPNEGESITLNEPVPVDHILRPAHSSKAISIGRYLQGPRKLNKSTVRLLPASLNTTRNQRSIRRRYARLRSENATLDKHYFIKTFSLRSYT